MHYGKATDRKGVPIKVGDKIRLLSLSPSILRNLPTNEKADVQTMLSQIVEVWDIYENGQIWAGLAFPKGDGLVETHMVAIEPKDIELVSTKDA